MLILSGWWLGTFFIFPYIGLLSSSQLTFIFFRGVAEPPTSYLIHHLFARSVLWVRRPPGPPGHGFFHRQPRHKPPKSWRRKAPWTLELCLDVPKMCQRCAKDLSRWWVIPIVIPIVIPMDSHGFPPRMTLLPCNDFEAPGLKRLRLHRGAQGAAGSAGSCAASDGESLEGPHFFRISLGKWRSNGTSPWEQRGNQHSHWIYRFFRFTWQSEMIWVYLK